MKTKSIRINVIGEYRIIATQWEISPAGQVSILYVPGRGIVVQCPEYEETVYCKNTEFLATAILSHCKKVNSVKFAEINSLENKGVVFTREDLSQQILVYKLRKLLAGNEILIKN